MKRIFYVACAVLLCACVGRADRNRAGATDPMKADGGLVYDVKNFGAVGDGVTDDTRAIQSALDYAVDHGGGTVYFPNGLYRLATLQDTCKVRAHLIVKPRQSPGRRDYVMIRLQGESSVVTPCSYASHTTEDKAEVWKNGTVLVSDAVGELQTDPAQAPVSVLAAGAGDNLYLLNQAVVRLQDLAFQVKAEAGKYPYLSGVNMAYAATVYTDNILIYSSIRNMVLTSPTGDGHYSAGFIAPRTWCNPEQEFRNICVKSAFRFGFVFSEHANGNNLSAWNCDNAFVFSFRLVRSDPRPELREHRFVVERGVRRTRRWRRFFENRTGRHRGEQRSEAGRFQLPLFCRRSGQPFVRHVVLPHRQIERRGR